MAALWISLAATALVIFLVLWLIFEILSWIPLGLILLFVILWLVLR